MRISAALDLTQFEHNGCLDEESIGQIKSYADSYFQTMSGIRPAVNAGICSMKGRINEKLQEHSDASYDAVAVLAASNDFAELKIYDDELAAFDTALKIFNREKESGFKAGNNIIFDQIDYTEHFLDIFRKMKFYFRRIQLNLAKPLQFECLTFVRQHCISICAVTQMLLDSKVGNMEDVAARLAALYNEQGLTLEAAYLLSIVKETMQDEDKKLYLQECMEQLM